MYLLHCLPGPFEQKAAVFDQVRTCLKPDGVLFGATILGKGPWHSLAARVVLWLLYLEGRLDNYEDTEKVVVAEPKERFRTTL